MDYNQMPAGREMDVLIAGKVMGMDVKFVREIMGQEFFEDMLPHFSTNISTAWDVVEKMQKDGWLPCVERNHDRWECFMGHDAFDAGHGYAETAPLAICRAALDAKGE